MTDFLITMGVAFGAFSAFWLIYGLVKLFGWDKTVFDPVPVQQQPADNAWLADLRDTHEFGRVVLEGDTVYPDGREVAPSWSQTPYGPALPPVPMTGLLFDPLPDDIATESERLFLELRASMPMTALTHYALTGQRELAAVAG